MNEPYDPQDALAMPTLVDFRNTLEAVLQTPYPPRSLFIQASSNLQLVEGLIRASLPRAGRSINARQPYIQDHLPKAVIVDCAEVASTKALYGRILNGLSGWGRVEWNHTIGGVLNWDGRLEGYSIQRDPQSQEYRLTWDYNNAMDSLPSKNASNGKAGIIDRKDESFSAFLEGLKLVFTLGGDQQEGLEQAGRLGSKEKPRFVVLLNAERIPELESLPVGQNEGTLLASFLRLGELTGKPIVPVLTSQSEWLLLRPSRGATEPGATLQLPSLKRQDIMHYLRQTCSRDLPTSSNLTVEQQTTLLSSLADLIHQTFEPYLGDELSDYLWLMEKLWPDWRRPVETGSVQAGDINRLVALFKNVLTREIEGLGELRPLRLEEPNIDDVTEQVQQASSTRSTSQATPKKLSSTNTFYANSSNNNGSPLAGFSPYANNITPSKRNRTESIDKSVNTNNNNINNSLSSLSKYLLIGSFLASSNPSKKDILMLATLEDDLALSKKRKKGGAMRRSRTANNGMNGGGGGGNDELTGPIRKKDMMVPQRMLGPKPFPIERLIAITETILPVELRSLAKSQDILQEISSLTSLRLLLKTTSSASSSTQPTFTSSSSSNFSNITISPFDKLDGIKLKCSTILELDFIESLGKSIGFKVNERLWETFT